MGQAAKPKSHSGKGWNFYAAAVHNGKEGHSKKVGRNFKSHRGQVLQNEGMGCYQEKT